MVSIRNCLLSAAVAYALPAVDCAPATTSGAAAPTAVPVAIGGKEASISIDFIALMLPEYDGTFTIHNQSVAILRLLTF